MNDIEATDQASPAYASSGFAWPDLALPGMFECLDAAGIDGRVPARYTEAARVYGSDSGTAGEVEGQPAG